MVKFFFSVNKKSNRKGLSDVDSDDDQLFIPPAESTPVGKRGRTQSQSPIRQKCGRKKRFFK